MQKKVYLLAYSLLMIFSSLAQEKQEIINKYNEYFKLQRENIFLHLNKDTFFTNEIIWLKGYVLDKKTEKLNPLTTNVNVRIYDENKNEVKKLLFYVSDGFLLGQIKLNDTYKSGKYYIHIYTNYMNNFSEDESTLLTFEIINPNDYNVKSIENNELNVTLNYEGGKLLFDSETNISAHFTNCINEGIELKDIEILNNNKVISKFITNKNGYGLFKITPKKNDTYSLRYKYKNTVYTKQLTQITFEGINLSVNSYAIPNHTIISLKTNPLTLEKRKNENLLILIQKNDSINYIDSIFDELDKNITINNSSLFKGINTIILLDKNNIKLSERLVYLPITQKTKLLNTHKQKDSLKIRLTTFNSKIGNFSVSVLPIKSKYKPENNSIINHLVFKNYTNNELTNPNYYFETFDRKKQFELDLCLIGMTSKYKIENIINSRLQENFSFDLGLTIEGKINQKLTNRDKVKIRLFTYNGINKFASIKEDNSFSISNILAIDSTYCHFSLMKNFEKLQSLSVYSNFTNTNRRFIKPIQIPDFKCKINISEPSNDFQPFTNLFKKDDKIIELDLVELKGAKQKKLDKNNQIYNSSFATGYKITEDDYSSYSDILSYISFKGFDVNKDFGQVQILNRAIRSINGSRQVSVFLDNSPMYDLSLLLGMSMREIDEVYINKTGFGGGLDSSNGIIKIYTKKTFDSNIEPNIKSKSILIKDGFQPLLTFKNENYNNFDSLEFNNYGFIDWKNNIFTDEKGNFELTIPHYNQEEIILDIQGFDSDGNFYHDIKPVKVINQDY